MRAKRPARLPVVLSRDEVAAVLAHLDGVRWLVAALLYGAGLRLLECLQLRVKDVDLVRSEIVVRAGKGDRDRRTMRPVALRIPLTAQLARVRRLHEADLAGGGADGPPARARAEIPQCPSRAGLAMGLSRHAPSSPPRHGGTAAASLSRVSDPARGQTRRRAGRTCQARALPHLPPLLRDSSARGRLRYPYGSRTPRSPRRPDDDGLHARPQSRRPRRREPRRPLSGRRFVLCGIRSRFAAAYLRETGCDGFPETGVFSATSSIESIRRPP